MTLCINPRCTNPHNSDEHHFCQACGSELLLQFRYRVIKEIGKGGFGQTYEVKEGNTTKVLKVLINTSTKAVELFKREAGVLKQLNQPSIPKVDPDGYFTFTPRGSQQPLHCLVMEKIVGLNLWDYIRELGRPIDGDTAKRWLSELITILQPVHERGILHRDIKPQNIIFKTDGRLALIDFGAIKEEQDTEVATEASRGTGGTELATGTRGKTRIQSPGYTPNEQMNGQAILPQSDFYALGRTFIYLLTGRGPKNIDYDPLNDKLNWQQYAPNVSPQLADLIDQMSATLVRDRPRSSQEVLQQLNSLKPSSNSHTERTNSYKKPTVNSENSTSKSTANHQVSEAIDLDLTITLPLILSEMQSGVQKRIELENEVINVNIPAGGSVGKRVRVRGKGRFDSSSQKRGDLYLIITATSQDDEQSIFNSSSSTNASTSSEANSVIDLEGTVSLTFSEMQSGVRKRILVEGVELNVHIPAGVSVGKRIRLRGKGKFDRVTQRHGDLYLVVTAAPESNTQQSSDSFDGFINELLDRSSQNKKESTYSSQNSQNNVEDLKRGSIQTTGTTIGIDLGATKSVVSIMHNGKPIVIPNSQKQNSTPTIVAYTTSGQCLIGDAAKRQAGSNPENTFYWFTHFLGCNYSEVADAAKKVAYGVRSYEGKVTIDCPIMGRTMTPEEILAVFLRKLVEDASQYLGKTIKQAVISVPIYFNAVQYEAVIKAAQLVNLECPRLIPQPSAAALTYGLDKKSNETILIFDLGGGSCNISLAEMGDGVFEIIACTGHADVGGDDFDKKIVDYLVEQFKKTEGIDLRKDKQALQRLTQAAELAKIELSSITQTEISLPFITVTQDSPKHLHITLTRAKFEELCVDLIDHCRVLVENAVRDAKIDNSIIDEVVLVGGSTRIPAIQEFLRHFFKKQPNQRFNRDETVAMGVAVRAGIFDGIVKDVFLLDVLTASLGVETLGGVMTIIIPRNTTIPTKKSEVISTTVDNQDSIEIHIVQGDADMGVQNKSLGIFRMDGIPPAPKGVPKIEVTFDIDPNGILLVQAKDKGTGNESYWSLLGR